MPPKLKKKKPVGKPNLLQKKRPVASSPIDDIPIGASTYIKPVVTVEQKAKAPVMSMPSVAALAPVPVASSPVASLLDGDKPAREVKPVIKPALVLDDDIALAGEAIEDNDDSLDDSLDDATYILDSILLSKFALAPALLRESVGQVDAVTPKEPHRDVVFVEKFCPVIGLEMELNHNKDKDLYNLKWHIAGNILKTQYIYDSIPYMGATEYGISPQYAVLINESMMKYYSIKYGGDVWIVFHLIFRRDVEENRVRVNRMSGIWIAHASALSISASVGFVDYIGTVTDEFGQSDGAYMFDVSKLPCYSVNYSGMPFEMKEWSSKNET